MIMMRLFAIRDEKAKAFTALVTDRNSAQAERNFKTAVKNPETDYAKYPEDFTLYEMGTYDQDTGQITPHSSPLIVCHATSLLQ